MSNPSDNQVRMKTLTISPISACGQCPLAIKGNLAILELPETSFVYCRAKADVTSPVIRSMTDLLASVNNAALENLQTIPDWCPLPDAEIPDLGKSATVADLVTPAEGGNRQRTA